MIPADVPDPLPDPLRLLVAGGIFTRAHAADVTRRAHAGGLPWVEVANEVAREVVREMMARGRRNIEAMELAEIRRHWEQRHERAERRYVERLRYLEERARRHRQRAAADTGGKTVTSAQ